MTVGWDGLDPLPPPPLGVPVGVKGVFWGFGACLRAPVLILSLIMVIQTDTLVMGLLRECFVSVVS